MPSHQTLFKSHIDDEHSGCVLYDNKTNEVIYNTVIPYQYREQDLHYFFVDNEIYFLNNVFYEEGIVTLKIFKIFPELQNIITEKIDDIAFFNCDYYQKKLEDRYPEEIKYIKERARYNMPIIHIVSNKIILSYVTQFEKATYHTKIYDKKFSLLETIDGHRILCTCNPEILVFGNDKNTTYYDIDHCRIIDSGFFLRWNADKAIEYDEKTKQLLIKEFVVGFTTCDECDENIDDDIFRVGDKIYHRQCYKKLKEIVLEPAKLSREILRSCGDWEKYFNVF